MAVDETIHQPPRSGSSATSRSRTAAALLCLGVACGALAGCRSEPVAEGPSQVAERFVAIMKQVHGEQHHAEDAFQLLWEPAKKNLEERARRASALSGRELHPGELIVPSWFALHINPVRVEERVDGLWANVEFFDGEGTSVSARLVKEGGDWKVALELPPLSPIRRRESDDVASPRLRDSWSRRDR